LDILQRLHAGESLAQVPDDNDRFRHCSRLAFMYTITFDEYIFSPVPDSVNSKNANDYMNF
jgi:hypothetical protein